jgi:exodeoxyribonuclease-3
MKKFVSWNVNGLRAVVGKGFAEIFAGFNADAVCLQETKIQAGQIDLNFDGYEAFYDYAERKGYSGTAIFTRIKAQENRCGIGHDEHDSEGRVVTLDLGSCYLVNVYTPNSRAELVRLQYRMEWETAFADYVKKLDAVKPVIICGDMNVAHEEIDLANPKTNHFNPGFSDEERAAMTNLLNCGFIDTFRRLHPDAVGAYSWWSYRGGARAKNVGWRIDYFLVSQRIADKVVSAEIHPEILGSDHCPVSIEIDI